MSVTSSAVSRRTLPVESSDRHRGCAATWPEPAAAGAARPDRLARGSSFGRWAPGWPAPGSSLLSRSATSSSWPTPPNTARSTRTGTSTIRLVISGKRIVIAFPERVIAGGRSRHPSVIRHGAASAPVTAGHRQVGYGLLADWRLAGSPTMDVMSLPTKRVLLAKPRGYCAGVDRAVQTVEQALERFGAPVYVRKQIVHNTHVVRALEKRGAIFVEETQEVPEGAVVVFSAHGVSPDVHAEAKARGLRTIDATCPLVTKVHNEARRFAAQGYDILLIGHEGHEEVIGTTGEAPAKIRLVDGPDDAAQIDVRDPERVAWLSQTTLSVDETNETVGALRERFPQLIDPPSDDICYATQNRQAAVKQIAEQSDLVIVVGSPNSSNSVRLVEVAREAGAAAAYLVDDVSGLDPQWLDGATTIGVTSGASVPDNLVTAVMELLAQAGFAAVEEVEAVRESLVFALPHELRRADL